MLPGLGLKVAKMGWDRMNHNKQPKRSSGEDGDGRRLGKTPKVLGSLALVGLIGAGGAFGVQRGVERYKLIETQTTAQGGEAEIIAFDADYEAHCWTATTMQVEGAGVKDEIKVAGVSVGWQTSMIRAQYEQTFCIDSTTLNYEVNQATGEVNIDIPSKDDISTQTNVVLGTLELYGDQTPGYVLSEGITKLNESLPLIENLPSSVMGASEQDKSANVRTNIGLILGGMAAREQCEKETWDLADGPFESGVKRTVSIGLSVAKAMRPDANIDPAKVSVTVENKPISELEAPGDRSNLDEAYKKIEEYTKANGNLTIQPIQKGGCVVSEEVKKIPTQTQPITKSVIQEKARNEES